MQILVVKNAVQLEDVEQLKDAEQLEDAELLEEDVRKTFTGKNI
jgi:hypothetical protein